MSEFGVELRRRRQQRQVSLAGLANLVYYSRGYLSRIENGKLPPNRRLAIFADAALDARGELAVLVPEDARRSPGPERQADPAALSDWGRELLAFGDALSIPLALPSAAAWAGSDDLRLEAHYRDEFDRHRRLSQQLPPGLLLRRLSMDFSTLMEVADGSMPPATRLRLLAARYAEFVGWMCQEAGRRDFALTWTRRAADLATQADDPDLAAYTLVREAELALYDGDAAVAVELAGRALGDPRARPRSRGLAAHRQAQAYALRGDHNRCLEALDLACGLLEPDQSAAGAGGEGEPVVGSSTVGDLGNAVAGWCHYDLGRPRRATELLAGALDRALAYEASGELEQMSAVTVRVLEDASLVRSASAYTELRGLSRALIRHHNIRALRDLRRSLDEALVLAP